MGKGNVDKSMTSEYVYSEITMQEIESMIESGKFKNVPRKLADYIVMMEMARDWFYKNQSKKYIIKNLKVVCKDDKGSPISDFIANKIYCDSINFFYLSNTVQKQAYRNLYAERLELAAQVSWEEGDMESYGKNIERAAKMRQLELEDPKPEDKNLKNPLRVIYTLDAKDVGVDEVPRYELAKMIDNLDIPETKKLKAKKDAGIEERNLTTDIDL